MYGIFTNIGPCPNSTSFVGFYIPAYGQGMKGDVVSIRSIHWAFNSHYPRIPMATPGATDSRAGSPTVPATGGWDLAGQTVVISRTFHGNFIGN